MYQHSARFYDLLPEMLAVARQRLPGVPLITADMRTLALGRRFDAVTCLFSSIGYVDGSDELITTVARFADQLNPGGVLIIEGWVRPDAWSDTFRGEPEVVISSGLRADVEPDYMPGRDRSIGVKPR